MDTSNIVLGRHAPEKREAAHDMRRNMTFAEEALWRRLRSSRLDGLHFRRQQVIDGLIVDFFCRDAGLVVEVDGSVHDDREQYDADRDRALQGRGLVVLRFSNERILTDIAAVLREIAQAARLCSVPASIPATKK